MSVFSITITDSKQLAGITAARLEYNSNLPPQYSGGGETPTLITPTPGTITSDSDYLQMVVTNAAISYQNQYKT